MHAARGGHRQTFAAVAGGLTEEEGASLRAHSALTLLRLCMPVYDLGSCSLQCIEMLISCSLAQRPKMITHACTPRQTHRCRRRRTSVCSCIGCRSSTSQTALGASADARMPCSACVRISSGVGRRRSRVRKQTKIAKGDKDYRSNTEEV